MSIELDKITFLRGQVSKKLLILNCLLALTYFLVLALAFTPGNLVLFYLLIAGEVYHLFQIFGFVWTVWETKHEAVFDEKLTPAVDIFITVAGEPVEVVKQTALAAKNLDYPNHEVYLLNDGYVAGQKNWQQIEKLACELGIHVITRKVAGGAKAGNINNGLKQTNSPYFVVLDADHVPHLDFLSKTMGFFTDKKMGFVQTPQFYKNQVKNGVTQTAWDQQSLFFGPIMSGKNRLNSAFMCGTNMVVRRKAIEEAGGMCEFNIAEDFLTSLFIHEKGWGSIYVPEVLCEGLAPEDFLSYYKQQFRWTRGSLEVIFKYNPLFRRGLSWRQKLQYLTSAGYFLTGAVILIDALLPLIFLFTGLTAVMTSTMLLAIIFLPYIALTLYVLQKSANFSYTFEAVSFSLSAWFLQLKAVLAVLTGQKTGFSVTSKSQVEGNFTKLVWPQLTYMALVASGVAVALIRGGPASAFAANLAWGLVYVAVFLPFTLAAIKSPKFKRRASKVTKVNRQVTAEARR
jgi:cellulose synthase (UDP-forming)